MMTRSIRNRKLSLIALVSTLALGALTVQVLATFVTDICSVAGSGESPGGIVLTVSAVEHENGNVTGHAMFHDRQTNSKLSIDVTEITVSGNIATVDGEVVRVTGTYETDCEGSHAIFLVQDNGEATVHPLIVSRCRRYEPGQGAKAAKPFGSEMGNLQVRTW